MNKNEISLVHVNVESFYLPAQSQPAEDRYVFGYTVSIHNTSELPIKLLRRHWIITDANGNTQEVNGTGVVGEQPELAPDEIFKYTSGSVLETPVGSMHGSYQMMQDDGTALDIAIPAFSLALPQLVH